MDARVREHAEIIVEHCVDIQQGDNVLVFVPPEAEDLAVAIHEELGKRGAYPVRAAGFRRDSRAQRAFRRAMNPEDYDGPPEIGVKMAEAADALILVKAATNTYEASDVPPEKNAAYQKLLKPVMEEVMSKRWVGTQYPAPGNARDAIESLDCTEYEDDEHMGYARVYSDGSWEIDEA